MERRVELHKFGERVVEGDVDVLYFDDGAPQIVLEELVDGS